MNGLLQRVARTMGADPANQPRRSQSGPKPASRVPFTVLLVSLTVGGVALLLALNTASAANELRRHDLADKDTTVAARLQQMRNQVAASAAPGNLGRAARDLGMVPADDPAFVVMEPNGTARVLGKARVAQGPPAPVAPKPKPTKTDDQPDKSSKSTTRSKARGHGTAKHSSKHVPPAKTTQPPKSTPTPTVTLPGGDR